MKVYSGGVLACLLSVLSVPALAGGMAEPGSEPSVIEAEGGGDTVTDQSDMSDTSVSDEDATDDPDTAETDGGAADPSDTMSDSTGSGDPDVGDQTSDEGETVTDGDVGGGSDQDGSDLVSIDPVEGGDPATDDTATDGTATVADGSDGDFVTITVLPDQMEEPTFGGPDGEMVLLSTTSTPAVPESPVPDTGDSVYAYSSSSDSDDSTCILQADGRTVLCD